MHGSRIAAFLLLGLIVSVAQPDPVDAQAPTRSGFFIGFGFGAGSFGISDVGERQTSASGYFKIGGALSEKVLLGAESSAWVKEEGGATLTSGALNAVVYLYPAPASGFYVKGGLGFATLEANVGGFGGGSVNGTALTLGAGYDIGFGGRFGLTPYGSFEYGNFDGGSTTLVHFGLGVNWY